MTHLHCVKNMVNACKIRGTTTSTKKKGKKKKPKTYSNHHTKLILTPLFGELNEQDEMKHNPPKLQKLNDYFQRETVNTLKQ